MFVLFCFLFVCLFVCLFVFRLNAIRENRVKGSNVAIFEKRVPLDSIRGVKGSFLNSTKQVLKKSLFRVNLGAKSCEIFV